MKVALLNFGCPKNLIDIELMAGMLTENGHKITLDEKQAKVVIINTCSFIQDAEKESVQAILQMVQSGKHVIVTGCLPQKHKKDLQKAIPEVKVFLGTSRISDIVNVVNNFQTNKCELVVDEKVDYNYPENVERQQITVGSSSYLKIAEGCNAECGYCIIPKLRGKLKSRPIENIIKEAKMLADKGVCEIILIAQDTTAYGTDLYGKPSLAKLLKELEKIDNLQKLRILYTYPTGINKELLNVIANSKKIAHYIDIPLQHSSPNVLKLMKRPVLNYEKLISEIRENIKDVAIRTTFIVGYPGETEEDFLHLKNFIETIKFDRVGIFEYSREKGTYSYNLPNRVPAKVKTSRKNKLMKIQREISKEINKSFVSKEIECIIESIDSNGDIVARTYRDAPDIDGLIYLTSDIPVQPTDIVVAKVTNYDAYDLEGEIIKII